MSRLEQALAEQKQVNAASAEGTQKQADEAQQLREQLDQLHKAAEEKEAQLSAVKVDHVHPSCVQRAPRQRLQQS